MEKEFNKVLKKHGVECGQDVYASFGSTIVHGKVAGFGCNSDRLIVLLSEEDAERGWSEFGRAEYIPGHEYGNKYWYIDEIVPKPEEPDTVVGGVKRMTRYEELLDNLGVHNGQRVKGRLRDEMAVVGKIVGYGRDTKYLVVLLEEIVVDKDGDVRGWDLEDRSVYIHSHKNKKNDKYWFIDNIVEE